MKQIKSFLLLVVLIIVFSTQAMAALPSNPSPIDSSEAKSEAILKAEALQEFKSLSKQERKLRLKDAKSIYKKYKSDKKSGKATDNNTLLMAILCVLLPPLAVYLHENEFNGKFWLSLLLTLLFWLPGVIYALLVIFGEA